MPTFHLTLRYDGTAYVGWQFQENGISIQQRLEEALASVLGAPHRVTGAGRTDSGVHALGQTVSFITAVERPPRALLLGTNAALPPDIRVTQVEEVPDGFDARRDAVAKWYRYLVDPARIPNPLLRHLSWHYPQRLASETLEATAQILVGEHDFSAFRAASCQAAHPVRSIDAVTLRVRNGLWAWDFLGRGFLHKQVRNMVGSLVEVGRERKPPEWLAEVLHSHDRTRSGQTAPPHGLILVRVFYPGGNIHCEDGGELFPLYSGES